MSKRRPPAESPTHPASPTPLAAAPISHTMPVPADGGEPDFLLLPDAPAVVILESADARTILIATTASARDLARRKLGKPSDDEPPARSARPDLLPLCAGGHVHAIHVGSSLEADAVYLHHARQRLPHLAKVIAERWRAWFVHIDPDAEFPQWTKTNLSIGLVGKRSASTIIGGQSLPPGVLLGPLSDKDAAGRLIEAMIDAFDLCRFHNLLVQAPKAVACAYKEMGRCPAPCDGSETMAAYRERTREAVGAVTRGPARATLDKPAFEHVASLHDCALLLLLPSAQPKHIRVALAHRGSLLRIADVPPADAPALAAAIIAAQHARHSAPALTTDAQVIDTIAVTTRWLFLPRKKRRGEHFRLDLPDTLDPAALRRAAKSVLLRTKPGEPAVEPHELEP